MRILMLTQWFAPEPNFKSLAFARQLAAEGHQVEVLTGFPNYPAGQLYPGYRIRLWQRESLEGIPVVRVPLYPSHDRSALRRVWNYLSFAIAATVLGPALVRRPDAIYVYHPPGTVALPAFVLGGWFRAPVVYDVNDLWPDTIFSTGMLSGGPARRLLDWFCRFVYHRANRVVVVTPGFRRTLIERGVAADKVHVIYNWAPAEPLPSSPSPRGAADTFHIVFAGALGLAQGLDAVLEAARRCADTVPHARFRFVGGGVDADRLERRAREMRLANVEFWGSRPLAATQAILHAADALLVHLKDDPLFAITIPSKTQAYLAAGRPLVMAVRGDAADLVTRAGAGIIAEPGNPESIAEAIRRMVEMPAAERERMGHAGREFYERELAIGRAVEKFDTLFREVFREAGRGPAPRRKRLFDIAVALTALVTLWPIMAVLALAVRLKLGSPLLFRQLRPGWKGQPFCLLKFRTMRDACAPDGRPLPDGQRLTGFGRFLRRTSLDELPQIWNVLKGDMSIVGPRPLLPEYVPRYNDFQRRRHEVKPGITGWAQVNGRNALTWERKFALDVWYVDHFSLWLDWKILWLTLIKVIRREDVTHAGYATTPLFMGNECAEKGVQT